jgi:hypothetical protein
MNRLELEASLEATYNNRMVRVQLPASMVPWDKEVDKTGRVVEVALWEDEVILQLQQPTGNINQYKIPYESHQDHITILDGHTTGGNGRDVFAEL